MSKGTANCTCRTCGKNFCKTLYETGAGASKRLADKIAWAENGGITECPECYKARKRAEEKAEGLTCEIRLGNAATAPGKVYAVFGGDTYTHKDALKAAGCHWTQNYPMQRPLMEILSFSEPKHAWVMVSDDAEALADQARELGAVKVTLPSETDLAIWVGLVRAGNEVKTSTEAHNDH